MSNEAIKELLLENLHKCGSEYNFEFDYEDYKELFSLLESEPEPGEFTKDLRNRVNELFKDSGGCVLIEKDSTVYIGWFEACKIIDRQANDIDQYRDMLKARKEEIDRLEANLTFKTQELAAANLEIKAKDNAIITCVGIIRASGQVNTKLLADKLEQALKGS